MDLTKVVVYEDSLETIISDFDIDSMEESGHLRMCNVNIFRFEFIILYPRDGNTLSLLAVNLNDDMDRYFMEFEVSLSTGQSIKGSFWDVEKLPLMSLQELNDWPTPRKIKVSCKVGCYYGPNEGNSDWQMFLTEISDFSSIFCPLTPHNKRMELIFAENKSTDITLLCSDGGKVHGDKLFLESSTYFKACLAYTLGDEHKEVILKMPADQITVLNLVYYLYVGKVRERAVVDWEQLFILAMYCDVEELAKHCELQLMTKVNRTMDCIKRSLRFAILFDAKKLKSFLIKLCRKIQSGN